MIMMSQDVISWYCLCGYNSWIWFGYKNRYQVLNIGLYAEKITFLNLILAKWHIWRDIYWYDIQCLISMYDGNLRDILGTVLTHVPVPGKKSSPPSLGPGPTQVSERLLVPVQRDPVLIPLRKPPSRPHEPSNLKVYVNKLRFEWESRTPVTVTIDLSKRLTRKQWTVQRTEGKTHLVSPLLPPCRICENVEHSPCILFIHYFVRFDYRGHSAQLLFVLEVICCGMSSFWS